MPVKTIRRTFTFCLSLFFLNLQTLFAQSPFANKLIPYANPGSPSPFVPLVLDSTRLPIVAMKLPFLWPTWDPIPDTPKVSVDMGIIDNGYDVMNHILDSLNGYAGKIGIEKRGSISQAFWYQQKSYGLETRDTAGNDYNYSLLGMAPEHDWILYAPFDDETFMRNVLMYQLGREMGYWAPRTKFCEVQFYDWLWQSDYRGIYVMMEKIKRDNFRVDIAKLTASDTTGDDLTGGYIFAVDKNIWAQDSGWKSSLDTGVFFSYKYPKGDEILPQQKYYLQQYVDSFETALNGPNFKDPNTGYKKYIDHKTFIDFFFMQELSKNLDGYRRSAYLHKDKNSNGGKIKAGPLWDFNSALYNAKLCTFEQDTGWSYKTVCWLTQEYHIPFWWDRFLQDSSYTDDLKCRWTELRSTVLDTTHIFHLIDSMHNYISEESVRHFTRFDLTNNIQVECDSLKWWLGKRLTWLDANMPGTCTVGITEIQFENSLHAYPNPTNGSLALDFYLPEEKKLQVQLIDITGRIAYSEKAGTYAAGKNKIQMDLSGLPAGIYFLRISGKGIQCTRKIVLTK
jgi:hypothetical protein